VIRRLNLPVQNQATFTDLTERRRILGMLPTKPTYQLLRETFFDTQDGALRDRAMTLRLRSEARGRDVLELTVKEAVNLQGVVEETSLETPVVGGGFYATLKDSSEVASRVKEIVEPEALRPLMALDIDREIRDLRPGLLGRPTHRVAFDEVVAHVPGGSRTLQEVTVTELARGKVNLEALGSRLRSEYQIESDGKDTMERVRAALVPAKGAPRPEIPHDVRVALMIFHEWSVALVEAPQGFALPTARGSGEEIAREYLGEITGVDDSVGLDLDLVGFATARRGGSDLEVWMHEGRGQGRVEGLVWLPLTELMERLGGPRLRDPGLIATLLMFVRSETGQRLLREAPLARGAPRSLPIGTRPKGKAGSSADDFLHLELSILDFNQRVLELAEDRTVPLLERFRFLSIFSSNMDEFFVVRVGRLKEEVSRGPSGGEEDMSAELLLDIVAVRARALSARQYKNLHQMLLPELAEHGPRVVSWTEMNPTQQAALTQRFTAEVFPLLTPLSMAAGPGRSFPRMVSLGLALAAVLRRNGEERSEYGYVPVPAHLDRFLPVPDSDNVIPVEAVIGANALQLFPTARIDAVYTFRASRLGDVEIDEDSSGDLLAAVADEVEARPFKPVIRLEVEAAMPREVRAYLLKELRAEQPADGATLTRSDIFEAAQFIDLRAVSELCDLPVKGGLYAPHEATRPLDDERSIFDILTEGDVLCHHPFHDFESTVGRFLRDAASDPDVVSIKLTLYRTGKRSPVMDALLAALAEGKDVSVFVELKARFDEESNIEWTHRLRAAGASVVYGVVGYKTHAKTALVVRREKDGVRRYVHIGTGNYNAETARFYTDVGLMSSDPDLGADLNEFFNELTGGAGPPKKGFRRLLVAPNSLGQGMVDLIKREVEHAKAGRAARVQVKINGLADRKMVKALYKASQKGVEVDLIVRSICTLRPGIAGLSEGIRVRSILGRFLEHSRIFYFENAGQSEYYIGSADWRARNLRRRVEVVTPVDDPAARAELRTVLDTQLADPRAWVLRPDGVFERAPS
jgi:polyphosphate kinase